MDRCKSQAATTRTRLEKYDMEALSDFRVWHIYWDGMLFNPIIG